MKEYSNQGEITITTRYGIEYPLCLLSYTYREDGSFRYVFTPHYEIIELLDEKEFQGIPGIDLSLKRKEYVRENVIPVYISERVPSENREDYRELLESKGMETMDPIEYLIRSGDEYFGDNFYLIPTYERKVASFSSSGEKRLLSFLKDILSSIARGDEVTLDGLQIDDLNRKTVHMVLLSLLKEDFLFRKQRIQDGIKEAKIQGAYKGRKPILVDLDEYIKVLNKVEKKEMTPQEGAASLSISLSKYYRLRKELTR